MAIQNIGKILAQIEEKDAGKYISHEWQLFGYRLAKWMDDLDRVSMYMKLAKNEDRKLIQTAWDFVKDSNARSKPRLFLWKLSRLRKGEEDELLKNDNNNIKKID